MKVIVEYNQYNTQITKALIPLEDDMFYSLELNELNDKVVLSTVHEVDGSLSDTVASIELTQANIFELSRLFSAIARGIEIKSED